jgi:hypothetical protein
MDTYGTMFEENAKKASNVEFYSNLCIYYIYNIDIYLFMDQVEVGHVFVQQSTAPPLPRGGVSAR